jgi:hypothetical protein
VKRIILQILFMLLIMLPTTSFSMSWIGSESHKKVWEAVDKISVEKGGFGGWFEKHDKDGKIMHELHRLIDGNGGVEHRHNGTHDPSTFYKKVKKDKFFKEIKIKKEIINNASITHNIADMVDPGPDGVNGWECTPKRRAEAQKLLENIKSQKGFKTPPVWAKEAGTEIVPKIGKIKSFVKKLTPSSKLEKFFSKIEVVVEKIPKGSGPVIYVIYEGSKFTYRVTNDDIVWEDEICKAVSVGIGTATAAASSVISSAA